MKTRLEVEMDIEQGWLDGARKLGIPEEEAQELAQKQLARMERRSQELGGILGLMLRAMKGTA